MYNIVIFGPPGSGKGTQADKLKDNFDLEHISTGRLLRLAVRAQTELGKKVEELINGGNLAPDELVNELVLEKLKELKKEDKGFILDGYPRNISQAKALSVVNLDFVFLVDISDEEALSRISNRVVCKCGVTYNLRTSPPHKEGICDKCSEKLIRRDDEDKEIVKGRLKIYHEQTDSLVEHYNEQGILHKIDGEQSIEDVAQEIKRVIEKFND